VTEVDGLNRGYAELLLEQYLEDPEGVPSEWRALFESGRSELVASHPGLARLLEVLREDGDGHVPAVAERPAEAPPRPVDDVMLGAVAAAMALVKAHRMHGHLAARLDPLGSDPVGDPALEPERLQPPLSSGSRTARFATPRDLPPSSPRSRPRSSCRTSP
jgi:2-oxoglutarate dehydrogenase complex dehydrogenase (E1) component-like enzyme